VLPLARFTAGSDRWRQLRTRSRGSAERSPWPLGAAVRTRAFAALFLAYFATSVAAYSVLPHSVAYLVEQGIAPLAAAGAFGLNGLMSTLGIIAMGWLSDRIGRLPTVTISYLSTMAGVAALMLVAFVPSMLLVYAFVLLFGLMQGARGPILVSLVAKIFAGGSVGAIFGALSLALGLGAAAGSWLSGLLHQWTGNYMASFALSLAGALTGLATFWLARTLRRESN
jgi:predicted MFS family arabinose efflux permease